MGSRGVGTRASICSGSTSRCGDAALGRALLLAAEAEARRRGCATIVLETHSFQAPDFYPAHGYEKVGETTGTPAGHTSLMFQKNL